MSPKLGRNDPCPCGSGKKHKHCCLAAAPVRAGNLAWERLRRLLEPFREEQLRFAIKNYGPGAIEEAWQAFTLWEQEDEPFRPDNPHMTAFMPWFYHCWSPDAVETGVSDAALHDVPPTRAYLDRGGARSMPLLRTYLQSCAEAPFSFHEVLDADPGESLRLRDILTGEARSVVERTASRTLRSGDVLFGQVAAAGEVVMLEACSPFAFSPVEKIEVLNFRERYGGGALLAPAALRELDFELLEIYHDLADRRLKPSMPELRNTDGDALSPRRAAQYSICSVRCPRRSRPCARSRRRNRKPCAMPAATSCGRASTG